MVSTGFVERASLGEMYQHCWKGGDEGQLNGEDPHCLDL